MKTIISLYIISLLFLVQSLSAQNNYEDVVYLKNGSIIHGIIIEQVPNQKIKIQTKDKNVFVFTYDEIEKITKEQLSNAESNAGKEVTFLNITELSYCPGVGDITIRNSSRPNEDYSFGISTINGFQVGSHFSMGVGVGFDKYKEASLMPLFLDMRSYLINSRVTPVLIGQAGYSIGFNEASNGFMFNPAIGVKVKITKRVAYVLNAGYKWQQQNVVYYKSYYRTESEKAFFGFISLKTGFTF